MVRLDEPSEGIVPILVEQDAASALDASDRVYVIDGGAVVHHAPAAALGADADRARSCAV